MSRDKRILRDVCRRALPIYRRGYLKLTVARWSRRSNLLHLSCRRWLPEPGSRLCSVLGDKWDRTLRACGLLLLSHSNDLLTPCRGVPIKLLRTGYAWTEIAHSRVVETHLLRSLYDCNLHSGGSPSRFCNLGLLFLEGLAARQFVDLIEELPLLPPLLQLLREWEKFR